MKDTDKLEFEIRGNNYKNDTMIVLTSGSLGDFWLSQAQSLKTMSMSLSV